MGIIMFWVCVGCLSLFVGVFRDVLWECFLGVFEFMYVSTILFLKTLITH